MILDKYTFWIDVKCMAADPWYSKAVKRWAVKCMFETVAAFQPGGKA
jgi:hypothetical protein